MYLEDPTIMGCCYLCAKPFADNSVEIDFGDSKIIYYLCHDHYTRVMREGLLPLRSGRTLKVNQARYTLESMPRIVK